MSWSQISFIVSAVCAFLASIGVSAPMNLIALAVMFLALGFILTGVPMHR